MTDNSPANTEENTAPDSRGNVVIDVRFYPSGLVNRINRKPANMDPQDWFDFLCKNSATYRPFAGGRGSFTIPTEQFQEICALKQAAE